jgi:hypothetical protein
MNTYTCENHKPINAESFTAAAEIFALRKARATYGRSGRVGALRLDSYSVNGRLAEFDAFIGRPSGRNETSGANVRFTIYRGEMR